MHNAPVPIPPPVHALSGDPIAYACIKAEHCPYAYAGGVHVWHKRPNNAPDFCRHCGAQRVHSADIGNAGFVIPGKAYTEIRDEALHAVLRSTHVPHAAMPVNIGRNDSGRIYFSVPACNTHVTCKHAEGWALTRSTRVTGWWDHTCTLCKGAFTLPEPARYPAMVASILPNMPSANAYAKG